MPKRRPARASEPTAEHVLLAMLATSLTLVGAIVAAAQLPEAIGAALALVALMVGTGAIGVLIARLLRYADSD
jgi:hypothetical protein